MIKVGVARVALFQRAAPERAFVLGAASIGEHDRQRDLAFAEIVTDILAELGGLAAVVERIVDQLKRDPEIHPERAAGGLFVLRPRAQRWPDLAGGGE